MLSRLKSFAWLKLVESILPLTAFLILGHIQRNVFDWTKLNNRGYERAIEVLGFISLYLVLYALTLPFYWLRPALLFKLSKARSPQFQPQTSEFFDLADRTRIADLTFELEFTPSFVTRKFLEQMNRKNKKIGIKLHWNPPKLFSCRSNLQGDEQFSQVNDTGIELFPFEKMNLENFNQVSYSFRFALGTTEVIQQCRLKPKHLNWSSRLLFGLHNDSEFIFEIRDTRNR